ncbi:MAG: helicase-related protein, partial [Mariniphaga sp.]
NGGTFVNNAVANPTYQAPATARTDTCTLKVNDGYEDIIKEFPLGQFGVSIVHGQMKPKDKEFEMKQFALGKTQIMVATTVIEVGVNVPNASVMIVMNAERFGLSQLHQLRGRVGRGADQSFCVLSTNYNLRHYTQRICRCLCPDYCLWTACRAFT